MSTSTFVPVDGSDPILFDGVTGRIHRLSPAAATIWASIDGHRSVDGVVGFVCALHRTERSVAGCDIISAIEQFVELGLVTTVPASQTHAPP